MFDEDSRIYILEILQQLMVSQQVKYAFHSCKIIQLKLWNLGKKSDLKILFYKPLKEWRFL